MTQKVRQMIFIDREELLNFERLMEIHWIGSTFCGRHMWGTGQSFPSPYS